MAPSVFTSSEKSLVKSVFPSSSYKILTVTPARVYAAYPSPDRWNYTGIEGALALVRDSSNCFFFKVLNLKEKGKIVWDHELYEDFYFYEDKSYFHTFAGDECMIGFCYADESGAAQMYKKVNQRAKYVKSTSSSSGFGFAKKLSSLMGSSSSSTAEDKKAKTAKAASPDPQEGEPQWNGLVDQLSSMGVSESDIKNNEGFLRDLLGMNAQASKPTAEATPSSASTLAPPVTSLLPTMRNAPPPLPPTQAPTLGPAIPSRPTSASATSAATPSPPPVAPRPQIPPPPPARPGGAASGVRAPPPVPSRASASGRGPPPPPPARPMTAASPTPLSPPSVPGMGGSHAMTSAVPPPPPPPPTAPAASSSGAPAPPPPPPPPGPAPASVSAPPPPPVPPAPSAGGNTVSGLPPPQPGRDALLASIQGKSVKDLRKTDYSAPPPRSTANTGTGHADTSMAGAQSSGNDLASALASALNKRKGNMGGSDEEESDDDW
ncbi:actin binding protein [Malassezia pachydermatis]